MKDFVENIYKVGDQKHNCPCTAVREIKNFTVSLLKKTRPRLEEKRVHSVAGELIEKAIYQMQTSPELKQLKMSTPPAPQELNKATPNSFPKARIPRLCHQFKSTPSSDASNRSSSSTTPTGIPRLSGNTDKNRKRDCCLSTQLSSGIPCKRNKMSMTGPPQTFTRFSDQNCRRASGSFNFGRSSIGADRKESVVKFSAQNTTLTTTAKPSAPTPRKFVPSLLQKCGVDVSERSSTSYYAEESVFSRADQMRKTCVVRCKTSMMTKIEEDAKLRRYTSKIPVTTPTPARKNCSSASPVSRPLDKEYAVLEDIRNSLVQLQEGLKELTVTCKKG